MRLTPRTLRLGQSALDTVHRLAGQYVGPQPLLDLSQGAPNYPTAPEIATRVAEVASSPDGGRYTPRVGMPELRELMASELSRAYCGAVRYEQVLITAGCNQAFCVAVSSLAERGDEVILPVPYYFDHDGWLRLDGITPVYLRTSPSYVPSGESVSALITDRTRAIVLVTPGNPTGVTAPPSAIDELADVARQHEIVLILDETYRAFRPGDGPPHGLFSMNDWDSSVVSLHSFSKEFAIPGYRVGAAVGHPDLVREMLKISECMTVCPPRIGQEAAIAGLSIALEWRRERARELESKRAKFESIMQSRPGGFELRAAGAFFGWVQHHRLGESSWGVAERLALQHGIVVLPGTLFDPADDGCMRFSFGNLTHHELDSLADRLRAVPGSSQLVDGADVGGEGNSHRRVGQ